VSTTAALSAVISANAVKVAPVGLAATISTAAALGGTTLAAPATATATKAAAMSILQKTLIAAALTAAVGAGIYQAHQASTLRSQAQTLQEQQAPLAEQIEQLRRERDAAKSELTAAQQEIKQLRRSTADLLRLRGEVARLRRETAALSTAATNPELFEVSASPTNAPSTQVNVKSRWVSGPVELLAKLGLPADGATAVLTDVEYRVLQKKLEKAEGVDILGAPEVTTVSSRAAQVGVVNISSQPDGSVKKLGPTLSVLPVVRADGITIDLKVNGRLEDTQPLGNEGAASKMPSFSDTNQWITAVVYDGQTIAISTKMTVLSPRSPAQSRDQLLVMFVSPTLIDPAGNRLHVDDELEELIRRNQN